MRKISIILLWWSRTKELEKMAQDCLKSIIENTTYENYEVIIIENKPTVLKMVPTSESVYPSKFLEQFSHKKVRIFTQSENLGFVKGNNVGMKLAGENDVLLLNNDTLIPKGWLTPLVEIIDNYPDCGMAMPVQIHKGSKEYFEFDGDTDKIIDYLGKLIFKYRMVDKAGEMSSGNWLPLCATIITRQAINKIGYLDENFKMGGFEDVDYSWRCLDANLKLYLTSGSSLFHYYGQSFHYHEGLAEVWVDTGKYLIKKHNALQDIDNNVYRLKDKSEDWFRKSIKKIKPEDIEKFEAVYGKAKNDKD